MPINRTLRTTASAIVGLGFAVLATGCVSENVMRSMYERQLHRAELREERQRARQAERDVAQSERIAREDEEVECARRRLAETVPALDSQFRLDVRQRLEVGDLEVDTDEMRDRLALLDKDSKERMDQWRKDMEAWRKREALHEQQEDERERKALTDLANRPCCDGCGAHCGCCSKCCDSCGQPRVPPRRPFTDQPPRRPLQSMLAQEVPMLVRMRLRSSVEDTNIERPNVRRLPAVEIPPCKPCEPCKPAPCNAPKPPPAKPCPDGECPSGKIARQDAEAATGTESGGTLQNISSEFTSLLRRP